MKEVSPARLMIASSLVLFAIAARWLPHPPNFTPLIAVALFSGIVFRSKYMAFLIPFAGLFVSDALIGFYDGMWANYLCFFLVGFWGVMIAPKGLTWKTWAGGSTVAALIFFATSNFFVWALGALYPKTLEGLWACYVAALPFFQNSFMSTLVYSGALWGLYHLAERFQVAGPSASRV